jgi:exosortase
MSRATSEHPSTSPPSIVRGASALRPSVGTLVAAGLVVVLAALVTVVFWDFFVRQGKFAIRQPADWGHTLVIPFIAGSFVYLARRRLLERPFRTTWIGFVPIMAGVAAYMLCTVGPQVLHHHNLRGAALACTTFGIVLLLFGFRAMLWLWFPLAYLFIFGQTISDRFLQIVTERLQDWTAIGAHAVMLVAGIDADRAGNTIYLYDDGVQKPLNIAEACSGMRMLMAFLALGVAMGYTQLKRNWQRAIVVLMGVPIAVGVNVLRVVTLSVLALFDSDFAAGDFHTFIGLVWLVPAFAIFLGVIWIVRNLVKDLPAPGAAPSVTTAVPVAAPHAMFDRSAKVALVLACLALAASASGFYVAMRALDVHLQKKPVALRRQLDQIPTRLPRWDAVGERVVLSAEVVETLGTDLYLIRQYERRDDPRQRFGVQVTYYTGMIDAVPHVPERCNLAAGKNMRALPRNLPLPLDESGWEPDPDDRRLDGVPYRTVTVLHPVTRVPERVRLPGGDFTLRAVEFSDDAAPDIRFYVGYFFIANGRIAGKPEAVKKLAFRRSEEYAYYCKVEVSRPGSRDYAAESFVDDAADLLQDLLPEVMRCLPDWSEIGPSDAPAAKP